MDCQLSSTASEAGFPRFGDLPSEIQTMIWIQAVKDIEPRLVYLCEQPPRLLSDSNAAPDDALNLCSSLNPTDVHDARNTNSRFTTIIWRLRHSTIFAYDAFLNTTRKGEKISTSEPVGWKMNETYFKEGDTHYFSSMSGSNLQDGDPREFEVKAPRNLMTSFRPTLPIPGLLLASPESHNLASNFYRRAFPTIGCLPDVYFSFERDVLLLDENSFWVCDFLRWTRCVRRSHVSQDFALVQNLAFVLPTRQSISSHVGSILYSLFGLFGNIKNITLLVETTPKSQTLAYSSLQKKPWQGKAFGTWEEFRVEAARKGVNLGFSGVVDLDMLRQNQTHNDLMNAHDEMPGTEESRARFPRWAMPKIRFAFVTSHGEGGI